MIRWICLCLFVLLATSCGGNYSNQSDRNDTHRSVVDSIPEFGSDTSKTKIARFDTLILEKMGCRVELFTEYLFDTIGDSVLMVQDHFPPVLNQRLRLNSHLGNLTEQSIPYGSRKAITNNGDTAEILGLVIWSVGIVDNGSDCFFSIEATGGCNACIHFSELANSDGEVLNRIVYDLDTTYEETGNAQAVLKDNQINDIKFRKGEYLRQQIPWW